MKGRDASKSTSERHSILELIHHEKARLMKKGWQAVIGFGIILFYFCCVPKLVYPIYRLFSSQRIEILVIVGITVVSLISRIGFNLIMNHIYASKYPYFEQYKITKQPWPWEVDEISYNKQYRSILYNTIIGSLIVLPLSLYPYIYFNLLDYETDPELIPSPITIFKHISFVTIIFETLFYWIHRLFHTPWLYKTFHKQHHEYQVTVTIAASYNHPVDYMLTTMLPVVVGITLLHKLHIVTHYMFVFYATIFGDLTHCGYDMPWYPWGVIPLGAPIGFHDYHHSVNIGNYGVFSPFWDAICGTNRHYMKYIAERNKND